MIKKTFFCTVSGAEDTVYTVPTGKRAEVAMMLFTNSGGSNGKLDVTYYHAEPDTDETILKDYLVEVEDFKQLGGQANFFIAMKEGDKIKADAESGKTFEVLLSVIEHNDLIQGG